MFADLDWDIVKAGTSRIFSNVSNRSREASTTLGSKHAFVIGTTLRIRAVIDEYMRKSILVVIACLLTVTLVRAADLTPADQKWLQAVEKMVSKGEKVTTPKEERVNIVKDWADKNGYSVKVNKVGNTFSIEFSVKETSKTVAQK